MPCQVPRYQLGQSDLAAIFQPQDNLARQVVVCDRRPDPIVQRRRCQAGRAFRIIAVLKSEGQRTRCAPRRVQEANARPAFGAEIAALGGDGPACRAAFGKRKVERRLYELAQRQHRALVGDVIILHKTEMHAPDLPPEIFDRRRRRAFFERALQRTGDRFLWRYIAGELAERLSVVTREFADALIIGPMAVEATTIIGQRNCHIHSATLSEVAGANAIAAEEDRLPFGAGQFDLIIAGGSLDSVNDLPGALVQIRRALRPDGLFLGQIYGAGSLSTMKSALLAVEGDMAAPHIHPQIDLRSAADLLSRAGFALPVADNDVLAVRYADWRSVVRDVRDAGIGNAMAGPRQYLGKAIIRALDAEWRDRSDAAGKVEERFNHVFLSGWAPSPTQPKSAPRGSGSVSLAAVLPPPSRP